MIDKGEYKGYTFRGEDGVYIIERNGHTIARTTTKGMVFTLIDIIVANGGLQKALEV